LYLRFSLNITSLVRITFLSIRIYIRKMLVESQPTR
jgi:hypothetical protein